MSSNIQVSVRLTEASRFGSPVIIFAGKSGKQHQFIWSPTAEKHLLGGKPITVAEWNKLAEDLLDPRERNRHKVIAEIIGADGAVSNPEDLPEVLKAKIAQLELAFSQSEEATVVLQSDLLKANQRIAELIAERGVLPEGVHPDEAKPRSGTWLAERANWVSEVEGLRSEITRLSSQAAGEPSPISAPAVNTELQTEVDRLRADNLELTKLLSGQSEAAPEPAKKPARKTAAQKKTDAAKETPPAAE